MDKKSPLTEKLARAGGGVYRPGNSKPASRRWYQVSFSLGSFSKRSAVALASRLVAVVFASSRWLTLWQVWFTATVTVVRGFVGSMVQRASFPRSYSSSEISIAKTRWYSVFSRSAHWMIQSTRAPCQKVVPGKGVWFPSFQV